MIEMLKFEHCLLEKKLGKIKLSILISTITRDDFSKKIFSEDFRYFGDHKEMCYSIVHKSLSQYTFEEKTVQTSNCTFSGMICLRNLIGDFRNEIKSAYNLNFYTH